MQKMKIRYSDYFSVARARGAALVRFEARTILDTATVQEVAGDLYALVDQHGFSDIVLDMTGVRFLSSQALGALVNLQRKSQAAGGKLVLAGVGENIARMFRITRLDCLFTFHEQADQALSRFPSPDCCGMTGKPRTACPTPTAEPNRAVPAAINDRTFAVVITNGPAQPGNTP